MQNSKNKYNSMHPNIKSSANDLSVMAFELNKKYNIDKFLGEFMQLFSSFDFDLNAIRNFVKNPFQFIEVFQGVKLTPAKVEDLTTKYSLLKAKYKFEEYIKEGDILRKKFLKSRRDYFYNQIKLKGTMSRTTGNPVLDSYGIESVEEYMLARWIDNTVRKHGKTVIIKYEDMEGNLKTVSVIHRVPYMDKDYVEAPLIDRIAGLTIFDSFLLHSFFDEISKKWIYIPIKLIISVETEKENEKDGDQNDLPTV